MAVDSIRDVVGVVSAVALALFTYLVWRIQASEYRVRHFPNLQHAVSLARFDNASQTIILEVLVVNASETPAVINGWEAIVADGTFRQSIADGQRVRTTLLKVPAFIGGPGWVLPQDQPAALSLEKQVGQRLSKAARIDVEIRYSGGQNPGAVLKHSVIVETS